VEIFLFESFNKYQGSRKEVLEMAGIRKISVVILAVFTLYCTVAADTASAKKQSRRTALGSSMWIAQAGDDGVYRVNKNKLKKALKKAPLEFNSADCKATLTVPMPDGAFTTICVEKAPLLSPSLQKHNRKIQTYRGKGVGDPSITARLDMTKSGFHAQLITSGGTVLVDPLPGKKNYYVSYWKQDLPGQGFPCLAEEFPAFVTTGTVGAFALPSGAELRTYRLIVTATGEYTQFFGGPANAVSQIATTINRVTGIYEREAAVRFVLEDTNVYENPAIDPFPTGDIVNDDLLDQHQGDLDAKFGPAAYDIGHIFTQGTGAGLASLGATCDLLLKARGGAAMGNPSGYAFDVDIVAHQIGHQMGAHHTFNGTSGTCGNPGMRHADTAFEPGSGSTIMALAGRCSPEDIQPAGSDYFHFASLWEISDFSSGPGSVCGSLTPTGNTPPIVDAGPDYIIPTGTPFTLTAVGIDGDGDALTYGWEQLDLGAPSPPPNQGDGPLFRSRPPTTDPLRTFPPYDDILAGTPTPWERLPTVDRDLTFGVTVRDNRPDGGGVSSDEMTLSAAGEPFAIIFPAQGDVLECGDEAALLWQVGGGSVAAEVRALISDDGGLSFDELIPSTPNDGSETVAVPVSLTDMGRIELDALANVFFSVSGEFSITDTIPPVITAPGDVTAECESPEGTYVEIGVATAVDICDVDVDISSDAPTDSVFPLGGTVVTWTAVDDSLNTSSDEQLVTVQDTIPPELEVALSPDMLWPPNHKMADISALVTVSDVCDASPTVSLVSITSSEPDNGKGDGNTVNDIQDAAFGIDDREFTLRSERSGPGRGRIYTVTYEAVDSSGNRTSVTAEVTVPHDQGSGK